MLLVLGEEAVPVNILNSVIYDLKTEDYIACAYEFDWYAGITLGEVYVKFMHLKVLSMLFKWSSKEDECWFTLNNDINVLKPQKSKQPGRMFNKY